MNITYKNEEEEVKMNPNVRELPVGTVIEFDKGIKALIINKWSIINKDLIFGDKAILLLTYSTGEAWFRMNNERRKELESGNYKILGKLVGLELER